MHALAFLLQFHPDVAAAHKWLAVLAAVCLVVYVVTVIIVMVPCWRILKKAGFTPWLALLCILPSLGTLVLLYVVAFSDWKVVSAPEAMWSPQPPLPPQS